MAKEVWVFNGAESRFPGGIFIFRDLAENWIRENKLTGVLTLYPVNIGVYDWAIDSGLFRPKKDNEKTPTFIGKFSSASQEHYHYEDGILEG